MQSLDEFGRRQVHQFNHRVVEQTVRHGLANLRTGWFEPFVEFRFPRFGTVDYAGVSIELRQAIEPWHVLGEEMSSMGTRFALRSCMQPSMLG